MGPRAKKKEEDELEKSDFHWGFRGGSPLEVVPPPTHLLGQTSRGQKDQKSLHSHACTPPATVTSVFLAYAKGKVSRQWQTLNTKAFHPKHWQSLKPNFSCKKQRWFLKDCQGSKCFIC